jgi:hypothetical protein
MLKQFNSHQSIRMLLLCREEEERDPLSSKLQSNHNGNDNGNDNNANKDTMIASTSKNHDNHNVVFFVPVVGCRSRQDAIAYQLPACQEKEGQGPIVVKALELQQRSQQ